jgi:diguanylate cyclase (GGDEF)-like protein
LVTFADACSAAPKPRYTVSGPQLMADAIGQSPGTPMTISLSAQIESNLNDRSRLLRFSPGIEARFEADTGVARNRHLMTAGLIALAVYDLFLFNDYAIRPEVFSSAALLRLGLLTPYGLVVLWFVRRGLRPAWREAAMASTVIAAMLVSCLIFSISSSANSIFDPFSFGLIILGGNVVFSLRFRFALISSLFSLLIMAVFLVHFEAMTADVKAFAMMVAISTALFTLAANYRLESSERKSYLLLLRETLRTTSAVETNRVLTRISYTDPLTKLPNRRQFDETLAARWEQARATGKQLGLLMIDIDDFKVYNDLYGHPKGDACLVDVAAALERQVRTDVDLVARIGGEEFAMVMPGARLQTALAAAERARAGVESLRITHGGARAAGVVTVSVGVALATPAAGMAPDSLLEAADEALYQAKRNGRNRVETAQLAAVVTSGLDA